MTTKHSKLKTQNAVRFKGIALPIEHGSYGFLFEPLLSALLMAFSFSAVWISLLVIGAFLLRQPLKVFLNDFLAHRNLPQTALALKFILLYGAIFLIGLGGSLYFVKSSSFLPFLLVVPLAAYQIYYDANRNSRQLSAEISGAIAISSTSAVIALADNWSWENSLALWAIFTARLIPSILYVRNRLSLEKGKFFSRVWPFLSHLFALIFIGFLTFYGLSSTLTLAMFGVLLGRAVWGLSDYRKRVKAMKIGVWEVIYGTLTALSIVFGYYLNV